MSDLNEYECEMLDAVLEAFGVPDSLTRRQMMELFDGDEATAFTMMQILVREGLITESGKAGAFELPERLILKPKGEKFLKEGGFARRYKLEQQKPVEVGGTLFKLQQQNMRLQNEKLANEVKLREFQQNIAKMQLWRYLLCALILVAFAIGFLLGRHFLK